MRAWHVIVALMLPLGCCRSREAFLYACAPPDATRTQRINHVVTLGLLDRLHCALATYASRCGGYPATLDALQDPIGGSGPNCGRSAAYRDSALSFDAEAGQVDWRMQALGRVVATGADHGYRVSYRPLLEAAPGRYRDYAIVADPITRDATGFDSYWMSAKGDIHTNCERPATEDDPVHPVPRSRPTRACS